MLLKHLYRRADDQPQPKIIDVFISKLRKKLRNASGGAAAGLAAVAAQAALGRSPNPAALARLTAEIEADMNGLDLLFSL